MSRIEVTYDTSFTGAPLVDLDGDVFNGVTRTPSELRQLAAFLLKVAAASEARPHGYRVPPTRELLSVNLQEVGA